MLDYIVNVARIAIGCSFPLGLGSLLVSLAFWGVPARPLWRRIGLIVAANVVAVDLLFFVVPVYMRIIDSIGFHFLFCLLFLRSLPIRMRGIVSLSAFLVNILAETIAAVLKEHFFPTGSAMDTLSVLIGAYWPTAGLLVLLYYAFVTFRISPGFSIIQFVRRKKDRYIPVLLLCFAAQLILTMVSIGFRYLTDYGLWLVNAMLMFAALLTLLSLILVLKVIAESRNEAVRTTQEYYIDDINRMFTTIRGQRHDFMNHVQVISSFIKMGKYAELDQYNQELLGETIEMNDIISIGNPALAALIQAKSTAALAHRIHFVYDCSGMESPSLGVKSIDLIKVLANLLDNAFDEAKRLPVRERIVELECMTEPTCLSILVRNRGTYIPEDKRARLFEPGFSTKTGGHQGLGLTIVKERLDFYQGSIQVESCRETGTTFRVAIPHKKTTLSGKIPHS